MPKGSKKRAREAAPAGGAEDGDGAPLETLEGFIHSDGALYLRDPRTGAVFLSERDERGELVRCGRWDAAGKRLELDAKARPTPPEAPAAASASSAPPSASAGAPAKRAKSGKEGAQSGKEGAQSGKEGAQSGKEGAQSGKAGAKTGKEGAKSGKEGAAKSESKQPGQVPKPPRYLPALKFAVTDADDHCETSILAYKDASPCLDALGEALGVRSRDALRVWDPYFCTGRVKELMGELGFSSVYNENEDAYTATPPAHDVLVTNPPYSGDHVRRLMQRVSASAEPALLLLPSYFANRAELAPFLRDVFFIVPRSGIRYTYHTPHGVEGHRAGRTAPFPSFWFVFAKHAKAGVLKALREKGMMAARLPPQSASSDVSGGGMVCLRREDVPRKLLDNQRGGAGSGDAFAYAGGAERGRAAGAGAGAPSSSSSSSTSTQPRWRGAAQPRSFSHAHRG